jgi:predicted NBD/HSP70 family sugar kinase
MSRATIARRCSVSKPTASHVVENLLRAELVIEQGRDAAGNGRPGRLVAFNGDAGFVVGMDVGGTTTRAVLANLEGTVVRTIREPTASGSATELVAQIARIVDALAAGPAAASAAAAGATGANRVLEVAIGTPGVVDRTNRRISIAPNLPALESLGFLDRLEEAVARPLSVMNDVNAATLGELRDGAGATVTDLAYVSIGTGLGFGLAIAREIHHGVGGRAGELGLLPYPPGSATSLEDHLSGAGVRRRHEHAGGSGNPEDAFTEAEEGREPGASVIAAFMNDLNWALTLIATLVDPDRIVLGGGIGLRCAPHLDTIRASVARSAGYPIDVAVAQLGDDSGLMGAVASALEPARSVERLLGGGPMASIH